MSPHPNPDHEAKRAELDRQVRAFLRRGGKIEQVPRGASAYDGIAERQLKERQARPRGEK